MAGKSVSIDIGSHSVKVVAARAGKHGLQVTRFVALPADQGLESLRQAGVSLRGVVSGLGGRDMNLRYSQVPPTPDWQLRNLMDLEIQDLSQQAGGALSADYNLLPSQDAEAGVDTVLLSLAKDEALDRLRGQVAEAGGSISGFTPNCIAIYNAYLKCGPVEQDAVICLANLGHETIDIALVKGTDLLFARNLSGGGKVLDDAIAAAFNVSPRKAETLKRDLLDLDPQSRGRFASGQAEKVTMAAGGSANAIVAAIQSSLAFCKAQTKIADLRLDKVLVAGGSARLRGLRGLLREALRCPVDLYDPFANLDLSALPAGDAEQLQAMRYESVAALGLCAGRIDGTLYALEVLPAAVRRQQRFRQRTVWNIVAALLAVALLAWHWQTTRAQVDQATANLQRVRTAQSIAKSVSDEVGTLVENNKKDRAVVDLLAEKAVPLHGALRVLRAVTKDLPAQCWLRKFEIRQGNNAGTAHGLEFLVSGSAKEIDGVDPQGPFTEYSRSLHQDQLLKPLLDSKQAELSMQPKSPGATLVEFELTFKFGVAAAADTKGPK